MASDENLLKHVINTINQPTDREIDSRRKCERERFYTLHRDRERGVTCNLE